MAPVRGSVIDLWTEPVRGSGEAVSAARMGKLAFEEASAGMASRDDGRAGRRPPLRWRPWRAIGAGHQGVWRANRPRWMDRSLIAPGEPSRGRPQSEAQRHAALGGARQRASGSGSAVRTRAGATGSSSSIRRRATTLRCDNAAKRLIAAWASSGSKLVALWMINRQRDSLELLADFMESIPKADVHVVRNGYFGEERKFELYHASKVRDSVESRGGKSVTLPDLADRVADGHLLQEIVAQRSRQNASHRQSRGAREVDSGEWRGEGRKVLSEVLS
jgi:hypothetical protein